MGFLLKSWRGTKIYINKYIYIYIYIYTHTHTHTHTHLRGGQSSMKYVGIFYPLPTSN